ncbi:hypothetical protein GGH14_001683 [Coemansia sp. RSA 370]|nr:hypothetical protein GGH14_001683 [Coemansia sp. RSA 370]
MSFASIHNCLHAHHNWTKTGVITIHQFPKNHDFQDRSICEQVITGCGAVAGAGAPAGLPPLLPAQPGTSQVSSPAKAPATISSCINLAAHDANGGTLLHVAMQSNLEVLAHWAITKGVDIFARDTHGKLADTYAESAPIHELLAQAPMGNACTAQLSGHATKFSSELHKWTNYAASDLADSPAASILSSDSDDELYHAHDSFFSAISELRSQLFVQDQLLNGLSKLRGSTDTPVSAEDIQKYHIIASQTTAQSRELIAELDHVY